MTQGIPREDRRTRSTSAPRFGLFLSQANKSWPQVLDEFQMAEELGFDHAWLVDHLVDTDGPPENGCLEGWTLLSAIAARTSRIRIGILVSSNTFRHPALLLKEAVTVDHAQRWPADPRPRDRLECRRTPALWHRPARTRGTSRPFRGGDPADLRPDGPGTDDLLGSFLSARRRTIATGTDPAPAHPSPDRRPPAPDAPDRGAIRRSMGQLRRDARDRDGGGRSRACRADRAAGRRVSRDRPGPGGRSVARPGRRATRSGRSTTTATSSRVTFALGSPISRLSRPLAVMSRSSAQSQRRSLQIFEPLRPRRQGDVIASTVGLRDDVPTMGSSCPVAVLT